MDRITGLPAHPLLVHIPVVLLPLAVIGVGFMLARRTWYERYRWPVLAIAGVGTLGAILAASSGEGLEEAIGATQGRDAVRAIHDHAEAGDMARTGAIVFFVVLAAWVLVPWFLERRAGTPTAVGADVADGPEAVPATGPSWLRPVMMAAVAIAAVFSMITVVNAGHSGASRAWEQYDTSPSADVDG